MTHTTILLRVNLWLTVMDYFTLIKSSGTVASPSVLFRVIPFVSLHTECHKRHKCLWKFKNDYSSNFTCLVVMVLITVKVRYVGVNIHMLWGVKNEAVIKYRTHYHWLFRRTTTQWKRMTKYVIVRHWIRKIQTYKQTYT